MQECRSQTRLPATPTGQLRFVGADRTNVVVAMRRQRDEDDQEKQRSAVEDVARRGFGQSIGKPRPRDEVARLGA